MAEFDAQTLTQARTVLTSIVDNLIASSPDCVAEFKKVFPTIESAAPWVEYGLAQQEPAPADTAPADSAAETDDEESLGLAELFGEVEENDEDFTVEDFIDDDIEMEIIQE